MNSIFPIFLILPAGNTTSSTSTSSSSSTSSSPVIQYPSNNYTLTIGSSQTLTPTLSGTPFTNCVVSPSLPLNLTINSSNCVISGSISSVQSGISYTITASNSIGSGSTQISITAVSSGSAPAISYSGSPYTFNQNAVISNLTPTLSGNTPTSCSASPSLPSGLTINNVTCVISGTPTGTQTATSHTITATNSYGSGQTTINITVSASGVAPTISYSGSPFTYTQNTSISNLTPTLTGNTPTSCTSSPALPTGLSINNTTCVVSGTPTSTQVATNHTITATNGFGNGTTIINITVSAATVAPTISYVGSPFSFTQNSAITTISASLTGNTPTSCTSSPALPSGLSLNNTTCAISGTPTATQVATSHTITATNGAGSGNTSINITVGSAPTVSYSGSPFTFTLNSAITTITASLTGNSLSSCTISPALPTGLSINNTSCDISGTPSSTQAGINHTITATNAFGTGTTSINMTVGTAPSLSYTGSPFTYTQNTSISTLSPSLSGNALSSCTASPSLPTGLNINNSSCVISGTPTVTQTATNHTITATNQYGNATAILNITVVASNAPPTLSYPDSPFTLSVGANPIPAWSVNLTGTPLTSCTSSPSLPASFSINNSTCQITGTANTSFTATNFTITAVNANGSVNTIISITAPP
ncbi:MAG: Ig domain-containing protein [Leptospira sp.]|nr:Ig domain-containing protein [Leptospira sp.]